MWDLSVFSLFSLLCDFNNKCLWWLILVSVPFLVHLGGLSGGGKKDFATSLGLKMLLV